jgi:secreted trypsin-like serine protease
VQSRRGLLGTVFLAVVLVFGAGRAWAAVGGSSIPIQTAPWTVLITQDSDWGVSHCGGSIVDASHIVTAAHCLYDPTGTEVPTNALSVRAGISNVSTEAGDAEQDRAVTAARAYPGYVWTGGPSDNDVAVLTLSAPLTLGGPTAQAVALPAASGFPAGGQGQVAGFGKQTGSAPADGSLRQISLTIETQTACSTVADTLLQSIATALCASGSGISICDGDSGSGLVLAGAAPVLLGVVSAGPTSCAPGSDGIFTWVGTPQILSFIGPVSPPVAKPAPVRPVAVSHRRPHRRTVLALPET